MEKQYSEQEKQQMIEELRQKQKASYERGLQIISLISLLNVIMAIVNFYFERNILALVINIGLSMALYGGYTWARYLFIFSLATNFVSTMYTLFTVAIDNTFILAFLILMAIYSLACAIILLVSSSVSEFLYSQKNG